MENYLTRLNTEQREAVAHTEGPLLIIAGAGSGKTSVLCSRIAHIITEGLALPWQILAVTFTNKAAQELRLRLSNMNIQGAGDIRAGTFHSTCVRILRLGIEALNAGEYITDESPGYGKGFAIYDNDDSLRLIKACMKDLGVSEKIYNPKTTYNAISRAKDSLVAPDTFKTTTEDGRRDSNLETIQRIYKVYQQRLKAANALDFNDLIMKTVELFEKAPEILEGWQRRLRYIMVDEYQDTNYAQYRLVSLLASKSGNLCVVGDEDQSIYRFRGATIENILSFEEEFDAEVIKLEQNYRSTAAILGAANEVISQNTQRREKKLFSTISGGDKVQLHILGDEQEEALFIAREIEKGKGEGVKFGSNAVLYRTNAQSRTVELAFTRLGIPYRMIGGTKFYERKEIKDIVAYMSLLVNPYDFIRFRRVINEPKRKIGDVTQEEITRISEELGISPFDIMANASEFESLRAKAATLEVTAAIFAELSRMVDDETKTLSNLIDEIVNETGYRQMLILQGEEGAERLENINELKSAAIKFEEEFGKTGVVDSPDNFDNSENPLEAENLLASSGSLLLDFLAQIALASDTDDYEYGEDKVAMMTIHAAKGLEFGRVFIVGVEENIFPSFRSLADPLDVEEERRLAYVAITRAKNRLYITTAHQRLLYGMTQYNLVSRFVREISTEYLQTNDKRKRRIAPTVSPSAAKVAASSVSAVSSAVHLRPKPQISNSAPSTTFMVGESVRHKVFGAGTVIGVQAMGGDSLLEIAFEEIGTKKIMANFAKVEKV
jgi:DNA helicase-2/ATP-dependent DNA helicase PcrA